MADETTGLPSVRGQIYFGGGTHEGSGAKVVPVEIYDGRSATERFTLDKSGFELAPTPALRACLKEHDLYDADETVKHLFPIAEAIALRHCPGATRAVAFDHILRDPKRLSDEADAATKHVAYKPKPKPKPERQRSVPVASKKSGGLRRCKGCSAPTRDLLNHPALSLRPRVLRARSTEQTSHELLACVEENSDGSAELIPEDDDEEDVPHETLRTRFLQGPLPHAHGDYTERSGRARAEQLLRPFVAPEKLDEALRHRFAIVNLWYAFREVESDPLAMCTWSSCSPRDVVTTRITFPRRVGETYKVVPRLTTQKWVYFSQVTPDEAILLKVFDTQRDVSRFTLHSAFTLPGPSRAPRQSTEVRILVLYAPQAAHPKGACEDGFFVKPFVPPHMQQSLASYTSGLIEQPLATEDLPPSDSW